MSQPKRLKLDQDKDHEIDRISDAIQAHYFQDPVDKVHPSLEQALTFLESIAPGVKFKVRKVKIKPPKKVEPEFVFQNTHRELLLAVREKNLVFVRKNLQDFKEHIIEFFTARPSVLLMAAMVGDDKMVHLLISTASKIKKFHSELNELCMQASEAINKNTSSDFVKTQKVLMRAIGDLTPKINYDYAAAASEDSATESEDSETENSIELPTLQSACATQNVKAVKDILADLPVSVVQERLLEADEFGVAPLHLICRSEKSELLPHVLSLCPHLKMSVVTRALDQGTPSAITPLRLLIAGANTKILHRVLPLINWEIEPPYHLMPELFSNWSKSKTLKEEIKKHAEMARQPVAARAPEVEAVAAAIQKASPHVNEALVSDDADALLAEIGPEAILLQAPGVVCNTVSMQAFKPGFFFTPDPTTVPVLVVPTLQQRLIFNLGAPEFKPSGM